MIYNDIKKYFTKAGKIGDYVVEDYLGVGTYGVCFKVSYGNSSYAAKIQLLESEYYDEVKIYNLLSPTYPLTLHHNFEIEVIGLGALGILILDLMDDVLINIKKEHCLEFMRDILSCLVQLHQKGIIHNDLKINNIFIKEGKYILGDFGNCVLGRDFWNDVLAFVELICEIYYQMPLINMEIIDIQETLELKEDHVSNLLIKILKKEWTLDKLLDYIS